MFPQFLLTYFRIDWSLVLLSQLCCFRPIRWSMYELGLHMYNFFFKTTRKRFFVEKKKAQNTPLRKLAAFLFPLLHGWETKTAPIDQCFTKELFEQRHCFILLFFLVDISPCRGNILLGIKRSSLSINKPSLTKEFYTSSNTPLEAPIHHQSQSYDKAGAHMRYTISLVGSLTPIAADRILTPGRNVVLIRY